MYDAMLQICLRRQRRTARRHRRLDELEQILRRARAPGVHEVAAGELRRFVSPAQIGDMAAGAAGLVGRASRRPPDRL